MNHTDQKIEDLQASIAANRELVETQLARAAEEERDLNEVETKNLDDAQGNIERAAAELKRLTDLSQAIAGAQALSPVKTSRSVFRTEPRPEAPKSLGEMFTDSEQYRSYSGRGSSDPLEIDTPPWALNRAVGPDPLLTTTSPGKELLPTAYKYRGVEHFPEYPLLNFVNKVEVSSSAVEVVVTTEASGHDVVDEGKQKPPVVWTDSLQTFSLKMVAGWYKWSRQAQLDIPNLRALIDSKLQQSLNKKLADLAFTALNGGFAAGNTSTGTAGAKMLDQVRNGIATLQTRGIAPNAVLMNPADHAALDISVMGSTMLGPIVHSGFFGLPVYDVPQIPAKTAIVGNFSDALTWFNRGGVNLYVTDSDVSDGTGGGAVTSDFRANLLTGLLETYGVFAVTDAQALQKVTIP